MGYVDEIHDLLGEFIKKKSNTTERCHEGILEQQVLLDFLSNHMENTPSDQYTGYSRREFCETFNLRFTKCSDVTKILSRYQNV